MARLLIVDDEVKLLRLLCNRLEEEGHEVSTATRAEAAEETLQGHVFDLLLTDVRLPQRSGIELLQAARVLQPHLQVVVMSAYGTVSGAVEAMRLGAFDYLLKPFELDALVLVVARALEEARLREENRYLRTRDRGAGPGSQLITDSRAMREVRQLVERVAATDTTVLLLGESGAGKERVAEAIHEGSRRHERPFIRVNCPAIPRDLLESELFGHVRGAFTGAADSRKGRFELADGGSLFLDEVGDLPEIQQGKLLNVLETRRFCRVGSGDEIQVDVRIVAATNRDLAALVAEGRFRADLYYRLNVFPVRVPPLRERRDDLPGLVEALLVRIGQNLGRPGLRLDPDLLPRLEAYRWPGNVRELRNVLERAAVLCNGTLIEEVPLETRSPECNCPPDGEGAVRRAGDLNDVVEHFKVERILAALRETGWRKKEAADRLGITPRALSHYLSRYDLERHRGEPPEG